MIFAPYTLYWYRRRTHDVEALAFGCLINEERTLLQFDYTVDGKRSFFGSGRVVDETDDALVFETKHGEIVEIGLLGETDFLRLQQLGDAVCTARTWEELVRDGVPSDNDSFKHLPHRGK